MTRKVLILTESLDLGGAESMAVSLANALLRRNCTVAFASATGVLRSRLHEHVRYYELAPFRFMRVPQLLSSVKRILNDFQPDIVHCQSATSCLFVKLIYLFRKKDSSRLILTHHSNATQRIPNFMAGFIFGRIADKVIAVAEHRRQSMLALGLSPGKIAYIPNFIKTQTWDGREQHSQRDRQRESLRFGSADHVLLCSARIIKSKRLDLFVRIVAELQRRRGDIKAIVLGDGPELSAVKRLAAELKIADRIHFQGFCDDVIPYYHASDIFVFPTEHEVLPMALVEALAAGLPAVCSKIPGNDEIIVNGENGFLIAGLEGEYLQRISTLLENPGLLMRLSENARSSARTNYDEDVCVEKILDVYDE